MNAWKQYKQGHGDKGSLRWGVEPRIIQALEKAFYESFTYLEPTGLKKLIAIDCSGSMFSMMVQGLNNVTAAKCAAVFAMVIARSEKNYHFVGFNTECAPLNISPNMSLDEVMQVIRQFTWGGTDLAQPFLYALKHKLDVDTFISFTDSETWAGKIHPTQALTKYRQVMGKPNAKSIICATSVTHFSVADPSDPLQIDIIGFDSAVPALISQFELGLV